MLGYMSGHVHVLVVTIEYLNVCFMSYAVVNSYLLITGVCACGHVHATVIVYFWCLTTATSNNNNCTSRRLRATETTIFRDVL